MKNLTEIVQRAKRETDASSRYCDEVNFTNQITVIFGVLEDIAAELDAMHGTVRTGDSTWPE